LVYFAHCKSFCKKVFGGSGFFHSEKANEELGEILRQVEDKNQSDAKILTILKDIYI